MSKIKTLAGALLLGGATLVGNAQNTSNKDLYTTIDQSDPEGEETNINKLLSAPEWTQYKPTDYGLGDDYGASVYFDTNDNTIVFGGTGGLTVKDGNVKSYGPSGSSTNYPDFPSFAAGNCSWKDGDTLYRGVSYPVGALFVKVGNDSWTEQFTTSPISSITKDDQGNLLVATAGDGIYVRSGGTTLQHYTTTNSGLPNNSVHKIIRDDQGNMLFFTWGGGLAKFDSTNWEVYNGTNTGLGNNFNNLHDAKIDQNGIIWTGGVKFYKFDITTGQGIEIAKPTRMIHQITSIDTDQFGNVHCGSQDGYAFYNPTLDTWTQIDGGTSGFTGWTNGLDVISDDSDADTLKVAIAADAAGLIIFKQSTADYLPQFPTNCHIDGEDSVLYNQSYTYTLSTPAVNASEYERSYTGDDVTVTPNGDSVELYFGPTATVGDLVCKIRNNFTNVGNDTIQKIFTIIYVGDDVGVDENTSATHLTVYPNPTSDILNVLLDTPEEKGIYGVKITNGSGQVVKEEFTKDPKAKLTTFSVDDLAAGVYVATFYGNKGKVYTAKFVRK